MIKTIEEIKNIVKGLGYELLNIHLDKTNHIKVSIKDTEGYKYDSRLSSIVNHQKSIVGKSNPYALYNISLWLKINNKNFELCDDNIYGGNSDKLRFYCLKCEENFISSWNSIRNGNNCLICSGCQIGERNSLAYLRPEFIEEWVESEHDLTPYEVTEFSGERVLWKCKNCGNKWESTIHNRSHNHNCPICSGYTIIVTDKNRLSIKFPDLIKEWHPIKNNDLTPDDVSFGNSKKVWWICSKCKTEWQTKICNRTRGTGCPKCNKSKGEKSISNFLYNFNIKFIPQYKFENCKYKNKLSFDFYLPDYECLIEYDGELHERPLHRADKISAQKKLEDTQRNDKIKTQYCLDNNIPLLRIHYKDFKNIEFILTQYLNLQ